MSLSFISRYYSKSFYPFLARRYFQEGILKIRAGSKPCRIPDQTFVKDPYDLSKRHYIANADPAVALKLPSGWPRKGRLEHPVDVR